VANKVASCFKRPISVLDSISLVLEASLLYQGCSLIDLFFRSPEICAYLFKLPKNVILGSE